MAYDEVRLFLEGAREAHLKCADLRDRARGLDSAVHRITAKLDGMPASGNADRNALLAALADSHGRLLRLIAEEELCKDKIADFIDKVPTSAAGREILRRRYLHYESWKGVRRWLSAHGMSYSAQSIYSLHGDAIKAARVLWEEKGEPT
jgi:hypothetical protein